MSILIDETKKVLVQGITGREGMSRTKLMMNYGTNVVAGCTPGKGGQEVLDVPVFDTVEEVIKAVGEIDISVVFVPAPLVKNAALESIEAGIKLLVLVPDRVPIYDVLEISRKAKQYGANFIGPNSLGLLSPDKAVLGMMGGRAKSAREWFKQGNVGVTSRSGGMTSSLAYYLSKNGIGLSTIVHVHVGGDAVVGLPHPEIIKLFESDPETEAVVMFGEIGGSQEEKVADLIEKGEFTKPLIAYIGGKGAKEGTRFSHAGAIVEGNTGTWNGKVKRLKEVGAHVVENFNDIPQVTLKVIQNLN
jgi:succinyl-CoA synthetase alpha subunit